MPHKTLSSIWSIKKFNFCGDVEFYKDYIYSADLCFDNGIISSICREVSTVGTQMHFTEILYTVVLWKAAKRDSEITSAWLIQNTFSDPLQWPYNHILWHVS